MLTLGELPLTLVLIWLERLREGKPGEGKLKVGQRYGIFKKGHTTADKRWLSYKLAQCSWDLGL